MEKKEIKRHKGYFISDDGKVFHGDKRMRTFKNTIGYECVEIEECYHTVAYLVADAFVERNGQCIVGFKDGDITNLKSSNLYWYYEGESEKEGNREIYELNEQGEIIDSYPTIQKAARAVRMIEGTLQTRLFRDSDITIAKNNRILCVAARYDKYSIKRKIREAFEHYEDTGGGKANNSKKVVEIDRQGNVTNKYTSATVCAKENNLTYGTFAKAMLKKGYYYDIKINKMYMYCKTYRLKGATEYLEEAREMMLNMRREIVMLDRQGNEVKRFKMIKDVAEYLSVKPDNISQRLNDRGYYLTEDKEHIVCRSDKASQVRLNIENVLLSRETRLGKHEVVEVDKDGNEVKRYKSLNRAADELGIIANTLRYNLLNKRRNYKTDKGTVLMIASDYDNDNNKIMSEGNDMSNDRHCFAVECDKEGNEIARYKDIADIRKKIGKETFFIEYGMPRQGGYLSEKGTVFMFSKHYDDEKDRMRVLNDVIR